MGDHELLQEYVHQRSNLAFARLVERYMNLVYTAARRQVRSPELAQEVAQSVFIDLARSARKLPPSQPLVAWLFLVTRRRAVDALRAEGRRQARQRSVMEHAIMDAAESDWSEIEPRLDDAIAALNEHDRRAVLLRFFENKPLREIGALLGTSEDAAQKRVSRALDRLRIHLQRRGVTVTAAGCAATLSSHAVQTAPAGLAAAIAPGAVLTAGALPLSSLAVMTTLQKSAIIVAAALGVGTTVYQARQLSQLRSETAALRRQEADLRAANARLRAEQEEGAAGTR